MNLTHREFLQVLASATVAGMGLGRYEDADAATAAQGLYELPPFGQVHFLHMTDCHAQLKPIHFREPSVNLGVGSMRGQFPHLVGEPMLKAAGLRPGSAQAHALTFLDFERAARRYGKVGGFAHLATLVKRLKASRPGALLLDGGDTWQGSGTALWTKGQDMVDAAKLLGVDLMTGHWEFTLGAPQALEAFDDHRASPRHHHADEAARERALDGRGQRHTPSDVRHRHELAHEPSEDRPDRVARRMRHARVERANGKFPRVLQREVWGERPVVAEENQQRRDGEGEPVHAVEQRSHGAGDRLGRDGGSFRCGDW